MEIFGGFMVMLSILGFFLAVLWFILPFVIFAMKGKLDRALELLESVDRRLAALERERAPRQPVTVAPAPRAGEPDTPPSGSPPPSAAE
ncbi:MAG TPA: hypothetical protein VI298_00910 [Geobacteraceae bacterium]